MNRSVALFCAVLPQFLLVGGLVVREEYVRATGRAVLLEIRPYDPMDPLSGRYLGTPLAIERLDLDHVPHDEGLRERNEVWVVLAPGDKHWQPVAVRAARPDVAGEQVAVCGEVDRRWMHEAGPVLPVRYPIGRFYIPEDGKDPTGWLPADKTRPEVVLLVKVTAGGGMTIEDLLVDGRPYAEWNR
jgi:uncharacterized membrane-anchored protein